MKIRDSHRVALLASSILVGSILAATPGLAQEQGSSRQPGTDQRGGEVAEIVVTAQKREERLLDVPASITAIETSALAEKNAVRLVDYLQSVPGTAVSDLGFGRSQVIIRGISTGIANNPTTGFTIDDVPVNSSSGDGTGDLIVPDLDPSDLQRVEVLRGPQGTLYGASSMGGLVRFVTTDPLTDTFTGRFQLDGSSVRKGDLGFGARGAVNIPVKDDVLGLRVNGFYRQDPGYVDTLDGRSDVNSGETYGGRIAAFVQITPDITLKASALAQDRKTDGPSNIDVNLSGEPVFGDLVQDVLPGTGQFDSKIRLYSAVLEADLGAATFTSVSGYSEIGLSFVQDVTGAFGRFTPFFYGQLTGVRSDADLSTKKWTQEVRLTSDNNDQLEWIVGGFFTREEGEQISGIGPADLSTGESLPLTPLLAGTTMTRYTEGASFLNLTFHVTDRFDLMAGGRYSRIRIRSRGVNSGILVGGGGPTSSGSSDEATTFLAGARFKWTDSLMTYATVSSGYRPGGSNGTVPSNVPQTYGSDSSINYEAGIKGSAFDRRMTFEAAVFHIDWKDLQIRQIDLANGISFIVNTPGATSRGAELSLQARPTDSLTLGANAAYTDAYLNADAPPGTFAPAGTQLPNSSKWTANFSAEQTFPLSDEITGFGGFQVAYVGKRPAAFQTSAAAPRFISPDYAAINLQVGARADGWNASLFVRNLTDERGILSARTNTTAGPDRFFANVIQPRTFGFSLAKDF